MGIPTHTRGFRVVRRRSGMDISALLDRYLVSRCVCPDHRRAMRRVVRQLAEQGVTSTSRISSQSIAEYLNSLNRLSTSTQENSRAISIALWNYAIEIGVASGPATVRPVRVRIPPVRAWTADDLTRLVKSCKGSTHILKSGMPLATYSLALALLGYESGLRSGDLHKLQCGDFSSDFSVLHRYANKTGEHVDRVLSEACRDAVRVLAALSPDGTLFKWALSYRWQAYYFKQIIRSAGLRGSIKWLRRSGATACERENPGSSMRYCAHRTPGLAMKHYVDWSQVRSQPTPPPIMIEG